MSYSENKFKDHIREVSKAAEYDSNRPLTLDELKELALSMGLTESEWINLLIKAEDSLSTALAHMKVQNFTDAIQSAEEATSINPYIKDGNAILAQCYLKLAYVDKNDDLFSKAEHYARMELKIDPLDGTALNVIGAVEAEKQEERNSKKNFKLIAIAGGGILMLLALFFMCSKRTNASNSTITESNIEQLWSDAESTKAIYLAAIQRRNELGLELLAKIQSDKLKDDFKNALVNYDLEKITSSETELKLLWGEANANGYFSEEDVINMTGQNNRIATAKKRYLEKAVIYNSFLKENKSYQGKYIILEINE